VTTRQHVDLEIAAARSAVQVYERCWQDIPDGAGTLERARANLAAVERRYAGLVAEPAASLVTLPWTEPPSPDPTTRVGQATVTLAVARAKQADAAGTSQRCMICSKPNSPFGFGLPPRKPAWACGNHRAKVAGLFVPSPYAALPRTKGNTRRQK
jgi:hypothetical protein